MINSSNVYLVQKNCNIIDILRVQRILTSYNQSKNKDDRNNNNDNNDDYNIIVDNNDSNNNNDNSIIHNNNNSTTIDNYNDNNINDDDCNNNSTTIDNNDDIAMKDDNDMNIVDDIEWLDSIIDDDTNDSNNNLTTTFRRLSIANKENISTTIKELKTKKSIITKAYNDNDDINDYIDDNDIFTNNNSNTYSSKRYSSTNNTILASSTLPIMISNSKRPSSCPRQCNETVKEFIISKDKQPVIIAYSEKSRLGTFNAVLDCTILSSFRRKSNMGSILYGGVLLITSKPNVEKWADLCRMDANTKLHVYNDSLKLRRQLGSNRLSQFDVVITTFEIARAKEIYIPLNRDNNIEAIETIEEKDDSVSWLSSKDTNQKLIERSNLHVLKWNSLIIDFDDITIMKSTSTTGKALLSLQTSNTLVLFKGPPLKEMLPKSDIQAMKALTIKTQPLSILDAR